MKTRHGFTLVELLVVVTIIGLLMGLTLKIVGSFVTLARESATETTIRQLQATLQSREENLHRLIARPGWLTSTPEYLQTGAVTANLNLRKILARKLLAQKYFPQGQVDFMAASQELGDQSGEEYPALIDAWGQPLRFYLWPTDLILSPQARVLLPQLPPQLGRDQDDPLGLCKQYPTFAAEFHAPGTYHVLLVVSSGADQRLGLFEPETAQGRLGAVADPEALTDDIAYLRVRAGGK